MTKEKEILSSLIVFSKYAKYRPDLKRRETWDEIIDRYEAMLCKKYPTLRKEIKANAVYIRQKHVLPSMRALQFAGPAMEVNNARGYNCCYLPIDSLHAFSETMFLLLGGTGVGYSVQKHHVAQLEPIYKPTKTRRYLIQDSIIGWADAVKVLLKAYMEGNSLPLFDFSDIRKKGARLITAGGKAPGPEPLKVCLFQIQKILDRKKNGEQLTPLECHDIMCHVANAVLAGGIRRAAMIALFSHDDIEMLECKYGNWFELNEQRGRANNSAVLKRDEISEQEFQNLWKKIELSQSGEPGLYWTNDIEWGTNPCCEVALRAYQFCNLCEINADTIETQEDLDKRAEIAAFFGTLQAGFTDFHYLRPIWQRTTEKDSLVGVGMTGIAAAKVLTLDLTKAAKLIKETNKKISNKIDINPAARCTLVKPSGTTSLVLGSSSGIHAWHDQFFLRTIRFNMNEDIASFMLVNHPELCEVDKRSSSTLCVRVPMKAPEHAIMRTETAIDLLERVKKFSKEWIKPGHREGTNTHNVSATISIKKNANIGYAESLKTRKRYRKHSELLEAEGYDVGAALGTDKNVNEWELVGDWMWENKSFYNGLSVIPYDGGTYVQTPFESCTEEEYNKRMKTLIDVDLTKVSEVDDNTAFTQTEACAGGRCEI
jgi:ribonucleoside-triphosphate reductase (thioredoxin)